MSTHSFLKKKSIFFSLLFLFSLFSQTGFGQSCPNNVSTPSGCPTSQIGEIDVSMGIPPSFCVNPSDAGCGTIRFINIPSAAVHGCPVELCFTPAQGCGVAGTNLCIYESDGMGGCNFLQVGSSTTGICVSPTASTYEITICRPGNGPVSAQNLSITSCCAADTEPPMVTCADFTATFDGCPAGLGPNTPNGVWFPIGPALGFTAASGGSYSSFLDLSTCISDNISDLADIEVTLFSSSEENSTACQTTLINEFSVRDECGNISPDRIITRFTIEDMSMIPPVITCPANVTLECDESTVPIIDGGSLPSATATDNCDPNPMLAYSDTFAPGNCPQNRVITRTWTAIDGCGETSSCVQTITIQDTEAPEVTCAEFTTTLDGCPAGLGPNTPDGNWFAIGADGGFTAASGGSFTIPVDLTNCVSDNCGDLANLEYTLHSSYEENSSDCQTTLVNEFSIRDECGNVAADRVITRITIQDDEAPVVTCADFTTTLPGCPAPLGANTPNGSWFAVGVDGGFTAASGGSFTIPVDLTNCVSDNCTDLADIELTLHSSYEENRTSCQVTLVNEFSVRDECGTIAADRVITRITIQDDEAPVVTCADFTTTLTGCSALLGPNTPDGNWFAVGADGGFTAASDGSFTIPVDLTNCVSDNCTDLEDIELTLHSSYEENRTDCQVTLVNEFSVRDECGTIAADRVITRITIVDNEAPEVTCTDFTTTLTGCPEGLGPNTPDGNWIIVGADGGFTAASGGSFTIPVDLTSCVTDNCSDLADLEFTLHSSYEENRMDCQVTLVNEFSIRDECGNIAADRVITRITIIDDEAPEVTCADFTTTLDGCPAGLGPNTPNGSWITVGADGGFTAASGGSFTIPVDLTNCVSDNCSDLEDLEYTLHSSYEENRTPCQVTLVNEFSIRDECENVAADRVITRITIQDMSPIPTITCPDLPAIDCIDVANYVPPMAAYSGTCLDGMVSGTVTSTPMPLSCGGIMVITYSGMDACGRTLVPITCEVTVNPAPAPTPVSILFLNPMTCEEAAAFVAPPLPYSNNLAGDCNISGTLVPDVQNNWTACGGEIIINYSGTDICGTQLNSGPFTITVNPAPLPTVTPPTFPASIECVEAEVFVAPNATFTNGLFDVCNLSGSIVPTVINNWDACGGTITVIYNGFDDCQRPLTAGPFTIVVQPAPLPVITPPAYSSPMSCATALNFSIGDATYTNGLTGACNISGTIPAAFDNNFDACGGNITVYYFGFDDCGRQISIPPIILAVQPAPIPTITLPALPASLSCEDAGSFIPPTASFDNGQPGACNLSGTATAALNHFYDKCGGHLEVIYLGEDACGRNLVKTIGIIDVDPAPAPTVDLPTLPTSLSCYEAENYQAPITSYDNGLTGDCNISGLISPTTLYNVDACNGGTITIQYNGTDDCGNILSSNLIFIQVDPAAPATLKGPDDVPNSIYCWDAAYGYYPGNAIYTNGESGFCENSGEIIGSVTEVWNSCDGGYIIYDYYGYDDCGNELTPIVFKISVLPDTWAPDGACAPYEATMSSIHDVPEPDELDYYLDQVAYGYYEACGSVNVTVIDDTGTPQCTGDGHFERIYTVEISDDCGNVAGTCTITFSGYCNDSYCTMNQKFYGSPNAELNGQTSESIINTLIGNGANPIVIGDGTDCGFIIDETMCIQAMLNNYGEAISLPDGFSNSCFDINNSLINQMVTTILNIRYNNSLNPAGSLDFGDFALSAACMNIPGWMLAELPANPTVNDMLQYANDFLACQCNNSCGSFQPNMAELTNLFWGLNSRFNNCHVPLPCGSNVTLDPSIGEQTPVSSNNTLELYPNPTNDLIKLKVNDFVGLPAVIEIFDTRGAKLGEKTFQPIMQNILEFDVQDFAVGMYWISIKIEGHDQITKKFIVRD